MSNDLEGQRLTADELSISKEQLSIVFGYAAQKYTSPKAGKKLSGVQLEVFQALFKESHTTMREIEEHNRVLAGKGIGTITSAISKLREKGMPVETEQAHDDKGVLPTNYTRYYLAAQFKVALLEEAMLWKASVDAAGVNADLPDLDKS